MRKFYLILKILFISILLVFAGIYFVRLVQKGEVTQCGFEIAKGESVIVIQSGTVARFGNIRIGASVGSNNSFNLAFLDGSNEQKFNVKECTLFEYHAGPDVLFIKVANIRSSTGWWHMMSGSNTASVELILYR